MANELEVSGPLPGRSPDVSRENLLLSGPQGNLEASLSYPDTTAEKAATVVICHPHPLHGGSMANKVVGTLCETFNSMGVPALRFNFRGVGQSDGRFDEGRGESEDLRAIACWVRTRYPSAPLWVAGFSFGAYVAMRAQPVVSAQRLLLVAPPVSLFDFENLPPVTVPWMVIQGDRDEVVDVHLVKEWVRLHPCRPLFRLMADTDHFFHGRLNRLRKTIRAVWGRQS